VDGREVVDVVVRVERGLVEGEVDASEVIACGVGLLSSLAISSCITSEERAVVRVVALSGRGGAGWAEAAEGALLIGVLARGAETVRFRFAGVLELGLPTKACLADVDGVILGLLARLVAEDLRAAFRFRMEARRESKPDTVEYASLSTL